MTSSLFLLFAVSEIIGAALSNSLSLFGDAAAMSVDVLTYFFNMYAEWYKQRLRTRSIDLTASAKLRFGNNSSERIANNDGIDLIAVEKKTVSILIKRSRILFEVVIPSISVTCLLAVTIYVSLDAVALLRHPPEKNDVNVEYLYAYAAANLLVDLICAGLFYLKSLRSGDLFLEDDYLVNVQRMEDEEGGRGDGETKTAGGIELLSPMHNKPPPSPEQTTPPSTSPDPHGVSRERSRNDSSENLLVQTQQQTSRSKRNINMMAAFSHILGDTLRTVAEFMAALVSTITGIDGDECDAVAAIVVSFTIVVLCCNIIREIISAAHSIHASGGDTHDTNSNGGSGSDSSGIRELDVDSPTTFFEAHNSSSTSSPSSTNNNMTRRSPTGRSSRGGSGSPGSSPNGLGLGSGSFHGLGSKLFGGSQSSPSYTPLRGSDREHAEPLPKD
eukprot:gene24019-32426_t